MNFSLVSLSLLLTLFTSVRGQDCDAPPTVTQLNFFGSNLTNNTLHIPGGQLRYQNIGTFEDAPLDLTVTIYNGTYHNISTMWAARGRNPDNMNGYMGNREFGNINLQYYHGVPNSGEGQFEFCLVDSGTNNPVTVQNFSFTVWDLDERGRDKLNPNNGIGIKEKLSFDTAQAYNYSIFPNFAQSEVQPICENGNTINCTDPECSGVHPGHISCPAGVRTVFRSSENGGLGDNPVSPHLLSDLQRKRAVFFLFENTSCFRFAYHVYCPLEPPHDVPGIDRKLAVSDLSGCRAGNAHPYAGGNFLFAGTSDALFTEAGCPTMTPSRWPTRNPTVSPTTSEPTEVPSSEPTKVPSSEPTEAPVPDPTAEPTAAPDPTVDPAIPPTPFPTQTTGNCPVDSNSTNGVNEPYGLMNFCVRSSYGYRYGINNTLYQEVNFIESLIQIRYNLAGGFCVDTFNVEPKEREETTVEKDTYGLQAWLCDTTQMENHIDPVRSLPAHIDSTYLATEPDATKSYYNQGALITVCVSPDDQAYNDGIRMTALNDFTWLRDSFTGLGNLEVQQTAIENSAPAGNFLTYYDGSLCAGADWCTFSSILFADFYINTGTVTGFGNATLEFARRRLEEGGRQLQEDESESTFGLDLGVIGMDDGPIALKTAGAESSRFSTLVYTTVLLASAFLFS